MNDLCKPIEIGENFLELFSDVIPSSWTMFEKYMGGTTLYRYYLFDDVLATHMIDRRYFGILEFNFKRKLTSFLKNYIKIKNG